MKFRNKAIFSLAILILASATSCKTPKIVDEPVEQTVEETGTDISKTAIHIEAGNLFGSGEEGITEGGHVINNWEDAKSFIVKMNAFNKGFTGFGVDVKEKTVVTYFDKVRPTLGFAVKFVSMIEYSDEIKVECQVLSPQGPAAEVITQPYIMVYLPKTSKKFTFSLIE